MIRLRDLQFVEITAAYSNAVLVAILPHVTDFARKMELPIPLPVTVEQLDGFGCDHRLGDPAGGMRLTNGYIFGFRHGHINLFKTPSRYSDLQDPQLVPKFFGELRMTDQEAVELCRVTIRKLGYTEEMLYADLRPTIKYPERVGAKVVPRYMVSWTDPRGGRSCEFEVNAQDKRIETVWFASDHLWRDPPKIDVVPQPKGGGVFKSRFGPVNPEYAKRLLPAILPEFTDYSRRLGLPISLPITTNHVASYTCQKFDGQVYADVILTNKHRFFYRDGTVQCYDAPDSFFDYTKTAVRVSDFVGRWRLKDSEAVRLAREALEKLGLPEEALFADETPSITKPRNVSNVPRIQIDWTKGKDGVQWTKTMIEIDAEHGIVKSIYVQCPPLSRPMPDVGVSP
jgi:hypothetical protein